MVIALLTAAGTGKRMGQDIPKQFLHVDNKPLIVYTMEKFQNHPSVDAILVVTLPSWMETFMRRPEIGGALAAYTQAVSVSFTDIIRLIVRIAMMPFVSMAGADNKGLLLMLERLSPLILLLPALAYGIGYLQGPARRKTVHTEIAENRRKRISREKRERKKRNIVHKEPEQLN